MLSLHLRPRRPIRLIRASGILLVLAGVALAPAVRAHPLPGPADPDAAYGWTLTPTPNPTTDNYLTAVAAVATNDVWAAGWVYSAAGGAQALITHWDGSVWSPVPCPQPNGLDSFKAVAAVATNDVWAGGSTRVGSYDETLLEHWNGTAWSVVASPALYDETSSITGISAVGPNDVWAVGAHGGRGYESSYALHWDGQTWQSITIPHPGADALWAVNALGPSNVWAAGGYADANGKGIPLTEHWNGTAWQVIATPALSASAGFEGVSGVTANDVWAVGSITAGEAQPVQTLTEHWDGQVWRIVTSPNWGQKNNGLIAVVALAGNDVWAAGYHDKGTLLMHWNGSAWWIAPSPNANGYYNYLLGLAAVSHRDVWTVGYYATTAQGVPYQTLATHYGLLSLAP